MEEFPNYYRLCRSPVDSEVTVLKCSTKPGRPKSVACQPVSPRELGNKNPGVMMTRDLGSRAIVNKMPLRSDLRLRNRISAAQNPLETMTLKNLKLQRLGKEWPVVLTVIVER